MNRKERKKYSQQTTTINRKWEKYFFPKVQKSIQSKVSSLSEHIGSGGSADSWFTNNLVNTELTDQVENLYKKVGVNKANSETARLRNEPGYIKLKGFGYNEEWVNYIINYFRLHLVEHISFGAVQTMRDYFMPLISKAISEGKSFAEIAAEIEGSEFARYQAARIVRTEVNSAASLGTMAAGSTYDYETVKEWISAGDMRVRGTNPEDHADHVRLDGKIVDYEDHFTDPKNGVQLMQPGDPKAKGTRKERAATIINCRCTIALAGKRDENDELIPKKGFKSEPVDLVKPIDDLGFEVRNIKNRVKNINETDLSPVIEKFTGLARKEDLKETDLNPVTELIERSSDKQVEIVEKAKRELEKLIEEKISGDLGRIDELIELVNSKEYRPEIVLNQDEVKEDISLIKAEIMTLINMRFDEVLKQLKVKRKYRFDIVRDGNDFIVNATATEL